MLNQIVFTSKLIAMIDFYWQLKTRFEVIGFVFIFILCWSYYLDEYFDYIKLWSYKIIVISYLYFTLSYVGVYIGADITWVGILEYIN
jgi:hypothetical protein